MRTTSIVLIAIGLVVCGFLLSPFNDQTTFQLLGNPSNDYKGTIIKTDLVLFIVSFIVLVIGALLLIIDIGKKHKKLNQQ